MHEGKFLAKTYKKLALSNVTNVPQELQNTPQWVAWHLKNAGEGRLAKVPVDAKTGRPAAVNQPETWSTFPVALAYAQGSPTAQGVGFVFCDADPYTGIDIDDCRDPETGALGVWAQEIIDRLDSYTEVSPSGTGVKIIVTAALAGEVHRRNKIEMYSEKRYFTITGEVVQERTEINERQRQVGEVYELAFGGTKQEAVRPASPTQSDARLAVVQAIRDEELLELARKARNGEKFTSLYDLGSSNGYKGDSEADAGLLMLLAYWTRGDEVRMDRLFRASKRMRAKFDRRQSGSTWGAIEVKRAIARCTAFYDPDVERVHRNDTGNADIFRSLVENEYAWVKEWKTWLGWNGVRWLRAQDTEVREATRKVIEERLARATAQFKINEDDAKAEFKWAIASGEASRRGNMERLARDMLARNSAQFDAQHLLLACTNGVIDLKSGELRSGAREDNITLGVPHAYDPLAKCPRFEKFLREVMLGDEEMVSYLWRVLGYTLTGDTSERAFFILHGVGRNGKSTLIKAIHSVMGEYLTTARFDTFLKKDYNASSPRDDVAMLVGARAVVALESDESKMLDAALIKSLSGGDKIVARKLYGENFAFTPTFKLLLVTNHVPKINESSHALWDRLHLIPFAKRFTENEIDYDLDGKLAAEAPGILARAVAGAVEWLRGGLAPPAKVVSAGEELHEAMDILAPWIDECIVQVAGARLHRNALFEAYQSWMKAAGHKKMMTKTNLNQALRQRGYEDYRGNGNAFWWKNLGLRAGDKEEQQVSALPQREPGEDAPDEI